MTLTIAVLAAIAGALVLEGRVIWACLRAAGDGGPERLSAQGSRFLASEVWVVVILGLSHGAYSELLHVLMKAGAVGAVLYVAGWMLRDLGLWIGPRAKGRRLPLLSVTAGAGLQLLGLAIFAVAAAFSLPEAAAAAQTPDSTTLLAWVSIPVVVVGVALQLAVYRLPPAPYFSWERRPDPFWV